jgi:3-keto-disaccharide hydrolase
MKFIQLFTVAAFSMLTSYSPAQDTAYIHPDTSGSGWENMFNGDLSNAVYPAGVWKDSSGIITANKDEAIWSKDEYDDFVLDLDFMNADGTNSGVLVHATDMANWIPHSVEIQIADDYSKEWGTAPATWQCAAIFGHQAAIHKTLYKPGKWNHFTITCRGKKIWVVLNGILVNTCDMSLFTSAKTNPDGSEIPSWLSNPMATLPLHGHIGFQGKHADAPIFFRNIKIKRLD